MNISQLPTEIHLAIVAFLDKVPLRLLRLVSWYFCDVSTPKLFSKASVAATEQAVASLRNRKVMGRYVTEYVRELYLEFSDNTEDPHRLQVFGQLAGSLPLLEAIRTSRIYTYQCMSDLSHLQICNRPGVKVLSDFKMADDAHYQARREAPQQYINNTYLSFSATCPVGHVIYPLTHDTKTWLTYVGTPQGEVGLGLTYWKPLKVRDLYKVLERFKCIPLFEVHLTTCLVERTIPVRYEDPCDADNIRHTLVISAACAMAQPLALYSPTLKRLHLDWPQNRVGMAMCNLQVLEIRRGALQKIYAPRLQQLVAVEPFQLGYFGASRTKNYSDLLPIKPVTLPSCDLCLYASFAGIQPPQAAATAPIRHWVAGAILHTNRRYRENLHLHFAPRQSQTEPLFTFILCKDIANAAVAAECTLQNRLQKLSTITFWFHLAHSLGSSGLSACRNSIEQALEIPVPDIEMVDLGLPGVTGYERNWEESLWRGGLALKIHLPVAKLCK